MIYFTAFMFHHLIGWLNGRYQWTFYLWWALIFGAALFASLQAGQYEGPPLLPNTGIGWAGFFGYTLGYLLGHFEKKKEQAA